MSLITESRSERLKKQDLETKIKAPKKKQSPLMEQYDSIKAQHPDELLLFRMGDFYELFKEDAQLAARVLNITLTKRNKKSGDETLMCGFPHHAMEAPINKLLGAGHSVAVCNQLEEASQSKGLVRRGVTLRLSPGVVFNPSQLNQEESHYIFTYGEGEACWFEHSTGKSFFQVYQNFDEVKSLVLKIQPKEILVRSKDEEEKFNFFQGSIKNLSKEKEILELAEDPKGLLLTYVKKMQGEEALFGFISWKEVKQRESVLLSPQFFKHMEIFESNEGNRKKCLFSSIKKTKTPGGTRLLRQWMERPLIEVKEITQRQKRIEQWGADFNKLQNFRKTMSELGDFERRIARAGSPLGSPQDLVRLKNSIKTYLEAFDDESCIYLLELKKIHEYLEDSIEDEAVAQWQSKGGYLKKGFNKDLDALIDVSTIVQEEVSALEVKEKERTQISGLKIRFNNVFGYYIEVTKLHKSKVPDRYTRRQTLTNAERYTTTELSELEERVLSSKSKRLLLEKEIYLTIKKSLNVHVKTLTEAAYKASSEDIFSSMAFLCIEQGFSIPSFNDKQEAYIKESFHPVVAIDLLKKSKSNFVTNDLTLNKEKRFYLITGPNMAGKSTLMRQIGLVSYMGQCGLPVPALGASLPIYDQIYTRIGASDALSEGLSTFMVEMKETAEILSKATSRSLLILDEIGRGTSSSDGLALAKSIMRYIVEKLKSHTLFATHYHELTSDFVKDKKNIFNIHLGHLEKKNEIVFTYKVKSGASERSYGIEVAKLAGLPKEVILSAKDVSRETQGHVEGAVEAPDLGGQMAFSVVNVIDSDILNDLKDLSPMEMTPLEALNKIITWQKKYL